MKPKPFVGLNHLTVPVATSALPVLIEVDRLGPHDGAHQEKPITANRLSPRRAVPAGRCTPYDLTICLEELAALQWSNGHQIPRDDLWRIGPGCRRGGRPRTEGRR